jgi:hypothetical protein
LEKNRGEVVEFVHLFFLSEISSTPHLSTVQMFCYNRESCPP